MWTNVKCLIIIETKWNLFQYGVHLGLLSVKVNTLNTSIKDDRFKSGVMVFLLPIQYIKTYKKICWISFISKLVQYDIHYARLDMINLPLMNGPLPSFTLVIQVYISRIVDVSIKLHKAANMCNYSGLWFPYSTLATSSSVHCSKISTPMYCFTNALSM